MKSGVYYLAGALVGILLVAGLHFSWYSAVGGALFGAYLIARLEASQR